MMQNKIPRENINGILLLNKAKGITSNRALQQVKRLLNAKKAGHTGSLDPIATGMLPICFGEATKFSQFLLESDKTYITTALLGVQTTTGDREGEVLAIRSAMHVTKESIQLALNKFIGQIEQIPPMYSAIKHQGQPLYELARKGIEIARPPRKITIHSIELLDFTDNLLTLKISCSKGTYIRTLVEDLGNLLECGAHVTELERLFIYPYSAMPIYSFDALAEINNKDALLKCLLPIETAVQSFPTIQLTTSAAFYLKTGQSVRVNTDITNSLVRLVSESGKFIGIGEMTLDSRVKPIRLVTSN